MVQYLNCHLLHGMRTLWTRALHLHFTRSRMCTVVTFVFRPALVPLVAQSLRITVLGPRQTEMEILISLFQKNNFKIVIEHTNFTHITRQRHHTVSAAEGESLCYLFNVAIIAAHDLLVQMLTSWNVEVISYHISSGMSVSYTHLTLPTILLV